MKLLDKLLDSRLGFALICVFPKAFILIAIGIVQIFTLGLYSPAWDFKWIAFWTKFRVKQKINKLDEHIKNRVLE